MNISDLLAFTVESGASDLHLSSGAKPMLRKDGDVIKIKSPLLEPQAVKSMIYDILSDNQRKKFEEERELDFAVSIDDLGRFRGNVFQQSRGVAAVFRAIPNDIMTLDEIGAPEVMEDIVRLERGMVLVTGPTGSGKSTTLAACVHKINQDRRGHILTIEDPVEFVHEPINCMVNHREVGQHTNSFAKALKSALREDPDIILIGEMRDIETISLALTAAETGHLVFGTLHTSSAPKTIDRIVDAFPSEEQPQIQAMLATSLRAVVAQTLLRRKKGGRIAAHEIMIGIPAVSNLIREGKVHQIPSAMQAGRQYGMQTMEDSLIDLVVRNEVKNEHAELHVSDPQAFRKRVERKREVLRQGEASSDQSRPKRSR